MRWIIELFIVWALKALGYQLFRVPKEDGRKKRGTAETTDCRELVKEKLQNLARILASKLQEGCKFYNLHESEFACIIMARKLWPELLDQYLPGYEVSLLPGWSAISKLGDCGDPIWQSRLTQVTS